MKTTLTNKNCSEESEKFMPVVNFNDCGGKADCVKICPFEVFEIRPISKNDKSKLNVKGQIKTFFFKQKAYVVSPEKCHACGLCIKACPEKAIKLMKFI